jgi:putative membrane protein
VYSLAHPTHAPFVRSADLKAAVGRLPDPDREFVRQASSAHMAAIRMGQLAMDRGQSERVRAIGKEMVDSHTALNDALRDTARTGEHVVLPVPETTPAQADAYAALTRLTGAEFDRAFLKAAIDIQDQTILGFNREAMDGQDLDLRAFASGSLPLLNERMRFVQREVQRM